MTLNVCLGKEFEGGSLFFRGVRCPMHQNSGGLGSETRNLRSLPQWNVRRPLTDRIFLRVTANPHEIFTYQHKRGRALLHRGHHRHGANAISGGERVNLILWCRAPTDAQSSERVTTGFREGLAKRQRGEVPGEIQPGGCAHWCWVHPKSTHAAGRHAA